MRIAFIIALILFLLVAGLAVFSYFQNLDLKSRLNSTDEILKRTQQLNDEIQSKLKELESKNEQIRADSVSILNQNNRFQKEIEELKNNLKQSQQELESAQSTLDETQEELDALRGSSEKNREALKEKIALEKMALEKALSHVKKNKEELKSKLDKQKAVYHYNLAVAYTKAELYTRAIEEYKKALIYDENNPEAYYNLGLLYESFENNLEKAIWNYTKYTELAPDADDRKEVQRWVRDLKAKLHDQGIWKSPQKQDIKKDSREYKGEKKTNISVGGNM
jgi:tetratricopeptide (TPR) repeat protein